ncbi:MAG TPA: response regulator transcription factor [Chitinophagales bacterium]|jgi:DNA-binding NarL/FixJ family response regulator|nr:response regulator transcription factor [Chitinophagales bacterium]HPA34845.1 response regulator transcription factor [Chitinophagales bacterium]HPW85630.1 response regulator transcription factor [Chitinophagales bacterium]HQD13137.1 response regulator transcription factor [Chitinophagales bacterium]HQO31077.1 response regulator transcription factor [Chitinophagales bacterium]
MITIGIVDDHGIVLQGVSNMFAPKKEFSVRFAINNLTEAGKALEEEQPQVLFLDINIKGDDGLDALKIYKKKYPAMKVIMLTSFEETALVKTAIRNGADGYLLKDASEQDFLAAIDTVLKGEQYIQKSMQDLMLKEAMGQKKDNSYIPKLTRREKEILQLIIDEKTTQEIADTLFLSVSTVETHRMNLISKLGVKNVAGLVKLTLERGLLKD